MKQILALSHARKSYDGKVVLDDVTLAFLPSAKISRTRPNGSATRPPARTGSPTAS